MDNTTTVFRKDYKPFSHTIQSVNLDFQLNPESTEVTSVLKVNPSQGATTTDLVLDGNTLTFLGVRVDGRELSESEFKLDATSLTLYSIDRNCSIEIRNSFSADRNTALSGIYMSHGAFMSQCESQGFRRITFYPDRPDVMSIFTVTIHADKVQYPVLLSNGNLEASGDEDHGRHFARWHDPFNKPCYLFALVAGDFIDRSEKFRLANGKEALLQVWTERQNYEKSAHALDSLKKAIRWDEERFGLELDLDRFMIVATDDFNFGAMENKGLNIFNSRCVMASPQSATDADYDRIESVVGHEYFHNWTGDRVTLRDWFQLTLKEGLTVFRDQEFSMDMAGSDSARAVKRIEDVRFLRAQQFTEDAGPMAHPIRPESYQEIDNFYTMTVYEKGAEVIRMIQTIYGRDKFRKGMDMYIKRHDGCAVTCDDFIKAMADACNADLRQFSLWWSQAGTPRVSIDTVYDPVTSTYRVRATQSIPATPGAQKKLPMVIPISIGLLDVNGHDMPLLLNTDSGSKKAQTTYTLLLTEESMTWVFRDITSNPVISIGRDFSAPVIFDYSYSRDELAFLASNDSNAFNRAEAMNRLALMVLGEMVDEVEQGLEPQIHQCWLNAFGRILQDESLSPLFKATILEMPSEKMIAQTRAMINPDAIHLARITAFEAIGRRYSADFHTQVQNNLTPGAYSPNHDDAGKRALKNLCINYWLASGNARALLTARDQFEKADNLTDKLHALQMIVNSKSPAKIDVLNIAAHAWINDPLLMNKWFTVQAIARCYDNELPVLDRIRMLMGYDIFSVQNPNNVYSLILAFMNNNDSEFHRIDGSGYEFWAEMIIKLDSINTHVASRVARCLDNWRRYEPVRARLMYQAIKKVSATPGLSRGVREVLEKSLNNH